MSGLANVFRKYIRRRGRQIRSATPWHATQSCSAGPRKRRCAPAALCSMWQEAHAFCETVEYPPTGGSSGGAIAGGRVNTSGPAGDAVGLARNDSIGIVAGLKADLAAGPIAHQEVQIDWIDRLHMRIATGRAFDVALDQLDLSGRVGGLTLRDQCRHQVGRIVNRQHQAERMRRFNGYLQLLSRQSFGSPLMALGAAFTLAYPGLSTGADRAVVAV